MTIGLVLDLDDTLYLERDYVLSGIGAVADAARDRFGCDDFADRARLFWNAGERGRLFDRTLLALGIEPQAALVAELVDIYRRHDPVIALAPDAARLLAHREAFSFALVTDGYLVTQQRKISALGLEGLGVFPLVCTDQWGPDYWKPHRRAFEHVALQLQMPADRLIYIADNPAKDFLGPRALGWRTIQIDRPGAVHPRIPPSRDHAADFHIQSLDELVPALLGEYVNRILDRRP